MAKTNLAVRKEINKMEVEKEAEAKEIMVLKIRFLLMDCTLDLTRPNKESQFVLKNSIWL